jgi:hypothetical protein
MAVPGVAEQLECQQGAYGVVRGYLLGPWEVRLVKEVRQGDLGEERQKEEKPAELGAKYPGFEIEELELGGIGRKRTRGLHSFVIPASGELGKAFVLEDGGDGGCAKSMPLFPQQISNIVDREILFAQRDDSLPERIGLGGGVGTPLRCKEELRSWIVSEVMNKDSETARSVSKALGRCGGRDLFDEESAQCLILALSGVGRLKKESFWIC